MEMLKIDENNMVMKTIKIKNARINYQPTNRVEFKLIRKEFHQKWEKKAAASAEVNDHELQVDW